jgi:hypothetical protein
MAKIVEDEYQDGLKAGVRGTPYSIMLLNNKLKSSAMGEINTIIQTNGLSENIIVLEFVE